MGVKISELPAAAGASLAMQLEVNNAGTSERLTLAQMFALSTGAVVADTPLLNFAQTWNNAAVAFTALKLNVTDTTSAAASLLMDLQVGGATKFKVDKSGGIYMPAGTFITALSAGNFTITPASGWPLQIASNGGLLLSSGGAVRWSVFPETQLLSSTAGVLEQRNSTNAQAFRVHGSYTDASNKEYAELIVDTTQAILRTAGTGTGQARQLKLFSGSATDLSFGVGGTSIWRITGAAGHLTAVTDNTYDIGASGANRPRNGYFSSQVTAGSFNASDYLACARVLFAGGVRVGYSGDSLLLKNNADNGAALLVLGTAASASFPALKRSAAELQCRLADDSGYADFAVARLLTLAGRVCWPGASGSVPDTPGTPDGYVEIEVGGTMKLIPFFNVS
jgi:hypothetical protein